MNQSESDARRLLEDDSVMKRFDARIRLRLEPVGEQLARKRVIAGSWNEAREKLERLPWEDQAPDGSEVESVEFELVTWEPA